MILLGENLPHTWRCKEEYFVENENLKVEAYVLHFHPTCFGKDFLSLPETFLIPKLFEKAKKGMRIVGESKSQLAQLLEISVNANNLDRIIHLLTMIRILSETEEFETIAPAYAFSHLSNLSEMIRLEKIYTYVMANYKEEITLPYISALANMSETSFCRYFKTMTKKTFSEFLIEIRISNACRELMENKMPTEVICYDCGFNNVSNFYRHFKKVTGMTPFEYKKKMMVGR
jgi:AraC-like DNA-binding protein